MLEIIFCIIESFDCQFTKIILQFPTALQLKTCCIKVAR